MQLASVDKPRLKTLSALLEIFCPLSKLLKRPALRRWPASQSL